MSTPIGLTGVARMANDAALALTFAATASATKTIGLDPTKAYDVFFTPAGPSDVSMYVTSDDPQAVAKGVAVWGPVKAYATVSVPGYAGAVIAGATAVKITHAKNGVGVDDAPTVALLGGRFQARFAEKPMGAADVDQGTYGDYTAAV